MIQGVYMKKVVSIAAIILVCIILAFIYVNSLAAYTTGINKDDKCERYFDSPKSVANSLVNSSNRCRIIGKGPFHNAEFLHLKCISENPESVDKFIFGSNKACNAFKELSSVEYIKLHLTTMLPPYKALKSGSPESGDP